MAVARDQPTESKPSVNVVDSDGNDVEMVVIGDVRYRADDPVVKKLREKSADKSRSGGTTK